MTDEERARAIVEKREIDLTRAARHALTQDILAALAAVREDCAKRIENICTCNGKVTILPSGGVQVGGHSDKCVKSIAQAIRTGP